jgi:hypothetical protein
MGDVRRRYEDEATGADDLDINLRSAQRVEALQPKYLPAIPLFEHWTPRKRQVKRCFSRLRQAGIQVLNGLPGDIKIDPRAKQQKNDGKDGRIPDGEARANGHAFS